MKFRSEHIGFLLLLIAGLLFIAHAIVPHHHHVHQVCIESYDSQDHKSEHSHANEEQNDQNNNPGNGNCIFNQFIVLPGNQMKNECDCSFITSLHFHNYAFIIADDLISRLHPVFWKTQFSPDATVHYTSLKTNSLGMRAPPAA